MTRVIKDPQPGFHMNQHGWTILA